MRCGYGIVLWNRKLDSRKSDFTSCNPCLLPENIGRLRHTQCLQQQRKTYASGNSDFAFGQVYRRRRRDDCANRRTPRSWPEKDSSFPTTGIRQKLTLDCLSSIPRSLCIPKKVFNLRCPSITSVFQCHQPNGTNAHRQCTTPRTPPSSQGGLGAISPP